MKATNLSLLIIISVLCTQLWAQAPARDRQKEEKIEKQLETINPSVVQTFKNGTIAQVAEQNTRETASTLVHEGDKAPDFTVQMLDGRKIKLSDLHGKVVLLNFWATWCGPCMMEFKEIPEKIIKHFEGKDFVMLAISREETREVVAGKMLTLKTKGIDFPVGLDSDRAIYSQYAKEFIPRNFVIDRNGKVSYTSVGYAEDGMKALVEKIEELLK